MKQYKVNLIDLFPADKGVNKNEEQWIDYFNAVNKAMISAPDTYLAAQFGSKRLVASLRKDFIERCIILSTHNSFNKNDLSAVIKHDYKSTVRKQKEIYVAEVPVYHGESIIKIVEDEKGLVVARAIFDTNDKPTKIIDTLSELSQKAPEDILFWTSDQDSRNSFPETDTRFKDNNRDFSILCDGGSCDGSFDHYGGRSRGRSMISRSGRAKK